MTASPNACCAENRCAVPAQPFVTGTRTPRLIQLHSVGTGSPVSLLSCLVVNMVAPFCCCPPFYLPRIDGGNQVGRLVSQQHTRYISCMHTQPDTATYIRIAA